MLSKFDCCVFLCTMLSSDLALAQIQKPSEPAKNADDFYVSGDYVNAVRILSSQIEGDKSNAGLYVKRGNAHLGTFNNFNAVADFNRAIKLDPMLADAYAGRGFLGLKGGTSKALALADFDKAINLDPKNADAHFGRFAILTVQGKAKEAEAAKKIALELDPGFSDFLEPKFFGDARIKFRWPSQEEREQADLEKRQTANERRLMQQELLMQQQEQLQQQALQQQQLRMQRRVAVPVPRQPSSQQRTNSTTKPSGPPRIGLYRQNPKPEKCTTCRGTGRCNVCRGLGYLGTKAHPRPCGTCNDDNGLCRRCWGKGERIP